MCQQVIYCIITAPVRQITRAPTIRRSTTPPPVGAPTTPAGAPTTPASPTAAAQPTPIRITDVPTAAAPLTAAPTAAAPTTAVPTTAVPTTAASTAAAPTTAAPTTAAPTSLGQGQVSDPVIMLINDRILNHFGK